METAGGDGAGGGGRGGRGDVGTDKSRYGVFTSNLSGLPTFEGVKDATDMITFIAALECALSLRVLETGTMGSTRSWGDYASQRLVGTAAEWGHMTWMTPEQVDCADFQAKIATPYIPVDYLNKLRMAFDNLTWNPKKSVYDFNEHFRTILLHLRIVIKDRSNDELDTTMFDNYIIKVEQAAAREKTGTPASMLHSAYAQWAIVNVMRPTLSEAMTVCSKIDDIHNRYTILCFDGTSISSGTQKPLTRSQGGDAMHGNVIKSSGSGNLRRRGGGRGRGREGHGGGGNKLEDSNTEAK